MTSRVYVLCMCKAPRVLSHHHPPKPARKTAGAPVVREIKFPSEFKMKNPLLSAAKIQEAREMAAVFPLLSVIENSMRELIKRVMHAKYGEKWWDTELTSAG